MNMIYRTLTAPMSLRAGLLALTAAGALACGSTEAPGETSADALQAAPADIQAPEFVAFRNSLGGPPNSNLEAHVYDLDGGYCPPGSTALGYELYVRSTLLASDASHVEVWNNVTLASSVITVGQSTGPMGPADDTWAFHHSKPSAYNASDSLLIDVHAIYSCGAAGGATQYEADWTSDPFAAGADLGGLRLRRVTGSITPPEFVLLRNSAGTGVANSNLEAHVYDLAWQFCAPGETAVAQTLAVRAAILALGGDQVEWFDNYFTGSGALTAGQTMSYFGPVDDTYAVHFTKRTAGAPEAYEAGDLVRFDVQATYTCQGAGGTQSTVTRSFTTGAFDASGALDGLALH